MRLHQMKVEIVIIICSLLIATEQLIRVADLQEHERWDQSVNRHWSPHESTNSPTEVPAAIRPHTNEPPPPPLVDWRKSPGRVGPVKNQAKCSAGYAFAATGVLEGQQLVRNISFAPLSEQQIIDCSRTNNGCRGGLVSRALDDLAQLGGIQPESSYQFEAKLGDCRFNVSRSIMSNYGHMFPVNPLNEQNLAQFVARFGPIAIELHATEALKSYKSGVFDDPKCRQDYYNHAALIVGYGTDQEAGDYWIVKNSWSSEWGEQGYFRLRRGTNACGLLQRPTFPVFLPYR